MQKPVLRCPSPVARRSVSTFLPLCARLFALLILASTLCAYAQVPAEQEIGAKPFGSYNGTSFESVNLDNGKLNLNIPLYSLPQRGSLKLDFSLIYYDGGFKQVEDSTCSQLKSTCSYSIETASGGPEGVIPVFDEGLSVSADTYPTGQTNGVYPYAEVAYEVETADGATHTLAYTNGVYRAIDGSGFEFVPSLPNSQYPVSAAATTTFPPGVLIDSNGRQYTVNVSSGSPSHITDPDGNYITVTTTALTDSLGRNVPFPPRGLSSGSTAGCPNINAANQPLAGSATWTVPGYGGGTESYLFCYATVRINTAFFPNNPPRFTNYDRTTEMLQSIVRPDGKYWAFIYDSSNGTSAAYGDLLEIIYPTGGTISYTWQNYGSICTVSNSNLFSRSIATRTENSSLVSGEWTYGYTYTAQGTADYPITTVTDPEGNQVVHTFTDMSGGFCSLYETKTQYLQNTGGGSLQPVKTVSTQYTPVSAYFRDYAAAFPTQVTTQWAATGQTYTDTTSYDSGFTASTYDCNIEGASIPADDYCSVSNPQILYGKPVSVSDYDYSGALLHSVQTSYLWQTNSNYLAANLLNTPSVVTISGPNGQAAQTTYTYDETGKVRLSPSQSITTQIGNPPSGVYGHVTTTTHWLNGGSSPSTSTYWLTTGEVDHTTDAKGNTTNYDYSAAYDGAYLTGVTNAKGQSSSIGYDFNTGLTTSTTDANGQTTDYAYDAMGRLTQVNDPDGGQTNYAYSPSGYPQNSVLKTVIMCKSGTGCGPGESSGQTESILSTYDGLGRPIETEMLSDPEGADQIVTSYNALGQVASVTNPYRSTSDPTYGVTSYTYDVLGRKTAETEPGGSAQRWVYSGGAVDYYDETGRHWQRTYNALGWLTKVLEPDSSNDPTIETDYQYDPLGNLMRVDQWGGASGSSTDHVRTFSYDSLGRLLTAMNPESGTTSYAYDADGNVVTKTSPAPNSTSGAITTTYTYDALNRLLSKRSNDSAATPAACYQYDQSSQAGANSNMIGRLANEWTQSATANNSSCAATMPTSVTTLLTSKSILSYDPMGRVLTEQSCVYPNCTTTTDEYPMSYTYNLMGNITSMPNGNPSTPITVTDEYNGADRLTSITDSGITGATFSSGLFSGATYDAAGQLTSAAYGTGVGVTRTYGPRLRITGETDTGNTGTSATPGTATVTITGAEQTQ